ncbi:hypothetical protein J2Y46_000938 [Microbacterium sp. BE35]|uniref:hypothetical protein n=1 Tax=Microbacterium sp. BE35 TaxID=2817773 RepID=UPI002866A156|nr:hypothetical protein [Microbacterium sp. BE35]MDR7188122.1 hypothetical protein [Microbacterium sp. BE35]
MNRIRRIHFDATASWEDDVVHDRRIVPNCGDIILNIGDGGDLRDPQAQGLLERWAEGWRFSLRGIDEEAAMRKFMLGIVFPALGELSDEERDGLPRRIVVVEGVTRVLPDFTVRVDGALVRLFLADAYDGPFPSLPQRLAAVAQRSRVEALR